jgi:hypothetical protein
VIEVDGPTHSLPIFGEEQLARTIASDLKKNGLLHDAGYGLLRVKQLAKNMSEHFRRLVLAAVLDAVPKIGTGYQEIEVGDD